ncbi:MAG TPA: hypothetical protein VFJ01_04855, partial [Oleiagrimonas sp.]|nr:hypothetical protein [Oleiagrimonas sp.]
MSYVFADQPRSSAGFLKFENHPHPTLPLKGRLPLVSLRLKVGLPLVSFPFKGKAGMGMVLLLPQHAKPATLSTPSSPSRERGVAANFEATQEVFVG